MLQQGSLALVPKSYLFCKSRGLVNFVNGAFDRMKELGLSDDFEKTRQNLLKLAVEEELNMDMNASTFVAAKVVEHPSGWGPVLNLAVNMDMHPRLDAWNEDEYAAAVFPGVSAEAREKDMANFPNMAYADFGEQCIGKSWVTASQTCRNWVMDVRASDSARDMNDIQFWQSMELFGSWTHLAVKKAFPGLFHKPLEAEVEARWKQNCSYAMLSLPSGEWWTPILAAGEVLQIYSPHVSELHKVWTGLRLTARLRQTTYQNPQAGPMIAISEGRVCPP